MGEAQSRERALVRAKQGSFEKEVICILYSPKHKAEGSGQGQNARLLSQRPARCCAGLDMLLRLLKPHFLSCDQDGNTLKGLTLNSA